MISKTDFLWFMDAPMHLWARTHGPLADQSPSAYAQHLMAQGQQVESLGLQYIEKFVLPDYEQAELVWQQAYDDGQYEIRVDALIHDLTANAWDLYEIKSATSVKKEYELDITFQALILEQLLSLRGAFLLHINRDYRHQDPLDLEGLFMLEEISQSVADRRASVAAAREDARLVTQMQSPGPDLACTKPRTCPCPDLCHPGLPAHAIYDLPYIGKKVRELRKMGVTAIEDIPANFSLNSKQRKHARAVKSGQPVIDQPTIRETLETLSYPLYFLDYETFAPALPFFSGYHPYEHIVFQYSLFVISHPGEEPKHYECLLTEPEDPAPKLVPHLLNNLGPEGSVIVWNQSFEAHRNLELAGHCPDYAGRLIGINDRLFDLMKVFKDGHYVHPDFHGSASLKAVLPVLCPDLGYEDLAIGQGEEAMLAWYWIVSGRIPEDSIAEYETNLKTYCRMDTYGMITILNKLREIIRS